MAIISTYSVSGASSSITISNEFSTLDELLVRLPDNTGNLILAKDVRDSVYTLWQRTISMSQNGSTFTNPDSTFIGVGGIPVGASFPSPTDMQAMWDKLLYPYVSPQLSLTINQTVREFGNSANLLLGWSVEKRSEDIASISFIASSGSSVNPNTVIPTGGSQNGQALVTGTHSISYNVLPEESNTFTLSVSDGQTINTTTVTSYWRNRIYWGNINLGGVNLSYDSSLVSTIVPLCTDIAIISLPNKELSISIEKYFNDIEGAGNHIILAWPSNLPSALSPEFYINGMLSNSFTRVRTLSPLVNSYGYVTRYEVWVSNTVQHSYIDIQVNKKL
jgi:hypothetical protein